MTKNQAHSVRPFSPFIGSCSIHDESIYFWSWATNVFLYKTISILRMCHCDLISFYFRLVLTALLLNRHKSYHYGEDFTCSYERILTDCQLRRSCVRKNLFSHYSGLIYIIDLLNGIPYDMSCIRASYQD